MDYGEYTSTVERRGEEHPYGLKPDTVNASGRYLGDDASDMHTILYPIEAKLSMVQVHLE